MTKTLYIITLEQVEKRYTKQWHSYWKKGFSKFYDKVINIDGTIVSDEIKSGRFLDTNQTNIWKSEQVIKVAKLFQEGKIKDGDTFIFMDAWNTGVTAIKYMSQLNNIKTKLYGYWHAGTYDPHDFVSQAGLGQWAGYNEIGWFNALDKNFVATEFHKELILKSYSDVVRPSKIVVVGFPMDWDAQIKKEIGVKRKPKRDLIVFPHRTDPEKNPDGFRMVAKKHKEYDFVITTEVTNTKKEYYDLISEAKIVYNDNKQETFGIGTVEAMMLGAIPLVPNRLVFPELYSCQFIFSSKIGIDEKIKYFMNHYYDDSVQKPLKRNQNRIKNKSLKSIESMARVMLR